MAKKTASDKLKDHIVSEKNAAEDMYAPEARQAKSFEQLLKRLEEISRLLDAESVDLDNTIALYEEGMRLAKLCYNKLSEAELKINILKQKAEENSQISEDEDANF